MNAALSQVVISPPGLAGEKDLLFELAEAFRRDPGSALLLVPTRRMARSVVRGLLSKTDLRALRTDRVVTLNDFAAGAFQALSPERSLISERTGRVIVEGILARGPYARLRRGRPMPQPGVVAAVYDAIQEMKRHGLAPDEASRRLRTASGPLLGEVLGAYGEYEAFLREASLADEQSAFAALARAEVEALRRGPLRGVEVLHVVGFSLFTPIQEACLRRLLSSVERVVIRSEAVPARPDLYGAVEAALARLAPHAPRVERPGESPQPFGGLAACLFSVDSAGPVPEAARVRFLRPRDRAAEVEAIAALIKERLLGPDPPPMHHIAVTFPNLRAYAPLVREVFPRYGLDFNLTCEFPLAESPLAAAVLAALDTVLNDFRREDLLRLLQSAFVEFRFGEEGVLAEPLVRREAYLAEVVGGVEDWRSKLERRASGLSAPDSAEPERSDLIMAECEQVRRGVEALLGQLDGLPRRATVPRFCDALRGLLRRLGILRRLLPGDPSHLPPVEMEKAFAALRRLEEVFDELSSSDRLVRRGEVSLEEFDVLFRLALSDAAYQVRTYDDAGIQVVGLLETQGLRFDDLFVGGLLNGEFPALSGENVLLAGDEARLTEQRLHFIRLISSARHRLTLSCPATDRGEPAVTSFFFDEVHRLCGSPQVLATGPWAEFSRERAQIRVGRLLCRGPGEASRDEVAFLARAAADGQPFACVRRGLNVDRARRGESALLSPDRFRGILGGRASAALARDMGREHLFSVTQFERYARCPFRFFAEFVLRLRPVEPPEEELTPRTRGGAIHEALYRFFVERRNAGLGRIEAKEGSRPAEHLKRVMAEVFGEVPGGDLFWQKELERLVRPGGLADAFIEAERREGGAYQPRYFEFAFGRTSSMGRTDPAGAYPPLHLSEDVRIVGKVDRVDVCDDGLAVVYDYKTGTFNRSQSDRDVAAGLSLQLPVYLLAVREVLHLRPAAAAYYLVHDAANCERAILPADRDLPRESLPADPPNARSTTAKAVAEVGLEGFLQRTCSRIVESARLIRQGRFPATEQDERVCLRCPYRRLCRRAGP